MIGKLPKKDIIALFFITSLAAVALGYGFSTIPTPADQRMRSYDHKRVSDLGQLKTAIDDTYQKSSQMPQALDEIPNANYSPESLTKNDPENKAPYEYRILSDYPPSYQLCATFTTDSSKENTTAYDDENYDYSTYAPDFKHPKGHYCFTFQPASYATPVPSQITITAAPLRLQRFNKIPR